VTCLVREGLFAVRGRAHNAIVNITQPNDGPVINAIVLARDKNEIGAMSAGDDNILTLPCIHRTWMSQQYPVTLAFAWQHSQTPLLPSILQPLATGNSLQPGLTDGDPTDMRVLVPLAAIEQCLDQAAAEFCGANAVFHTST
jgi:hypothetical protein